MFSFWSNDEDENSDQSNENAEEKNKTRKPERFPYVNKKDDRHSNTLSDLNVFQNNRSVKMFKEKRKQMDDMLNEVWSVRKDVRVNNTVKAIDVGQKSYYSRHGGVSGLHSETNHTKDTVRGGNTAVTKTWSVPRQGYSYTDNTAVNHVDVLGDSNIPDNIRDPLPTEHHDPDVHRQNMVNTLKHGVSGPNVSTRELSARTKRAQKFNNAYLRSTGMGKYTPHVTKSSDHNSGHEKKWNS